MCVHSRSPQRLVALVNQVLQSSQVLAHILRLQQLDTIDIEGAYYLYCRLHGLGTHHLERCAR